MNRWRKIVDTVIEKGKGPVLGKLRTIQLIKADLQLLMRIFIGIRNYKKIESDPWVSKYNFGSRPIYSIETALLKKCLMHDMSVLSIKEMIHTMADLESAHDR